MFSGNMFGLDKWKLLSCGEEAQHLKLASGKKKYTYDDWFVQRHVTDLQ